MMTTACSLCTLQRPADDDSPTVHDSDTSSTQHSQPRLYAVM